MYLSKSFLLQKSFMNIDLFLWLITFFVSTMFILIVLIVVILICSSYRRKHHMLMNGSVYNGNCGIFFVDKCGANGTKIISLASIEKSNDRKPVSNISVVGDKRHRCICCLNCRTDSLIHADEEEFVLIDGEGKIMNIEIRDRDQDDKNMLQSSAELSDEKYEYENGRLSHIDRELPPLPLLDINSECKNSLVKDSLNASLVGSLKYSDLENLPPADNTSNSTRGDESGLSRQPSGSITHSPVTLKTFEASKFPCERCRLVNSPVVPSVDDLSSTDYDPTYAAIRRIKVSCSVCGAPSVYTSVNSNRNSDLSLQLNSCLGSPAHCPGTMVANYESLNNSTYAIIAKNVKNSSEKSENGDEDMMSGCSTIKRQRSISQGDIIFGCRLKNGKVQQKDLVRDSLEMDEKVQVHDIGNAGVIGYMSLWSLMASNRQSSNNVFPIIPERTYGQSVLDLVEKLRATEELSKCNIDRYGLNSNFRRCYTPPVLCNNSFQRRGSLTNYKERVWIPKSCQMIHSSSTSKSGLFSPLKIFGQEDMFSRYDCDFPDTLGTPHSNSANKYTSGSSKRNFQPVLTPPLSPMDSDEKDTDVNLCISQPPESKFESRSFFETENSDDNTIKKKGSVYDDLDGEIKPNEIVAEGSNDHYEYLPDSLQLCLTDYSYSAPEKLIPYLIPGDHQTLSSRARPISIDGIKKDKYCNYRLENLEAYEASSVQMSPLMEQSLENSSSKTTLSSLSYHQFNRLISSEDSYAKSPPSAEVSPSLDQLEISPDDHNFLYNDFVWSNFNSAFDDYETFE